MRKHDAFDLYLLHNKVFLAGGGVQPAAICCQVFTRYSEDGNFIVPSRKLAENTFFSRKERNKRD